MDLTQSPDRAPQDTTTAITPEAHTRTPEVHAKIDSAIKNIQDFVFEPPTDTDDQTEETYGEQEVALIMTRYNNARGQDSTSPCITTPKWPYGQEKPNPISINKAKRMLSDAYVEVYCDILEAGVHGYAWMIEDDKEWLPRPDVTSIIMPPPRPMKAKNSDVRGMLKYTKDT